MKTSLYKYAFNTWTKYSKNILNDDLEANLVLCFGNKKILSQNDIYHSINQKFRNAEILMCSTAGEIYQDSVSDDTMVVTALQFEKTKFKTSQINIADYENSYEAAKSLINLLPQNDLTYILVISDGSVVNGSELVKGLNDATNDKVLVTGGLAGDDANFVSTLVGLNEQPSTGKIAAIGFYGDNLIVSHGSQGGWDTFGPERLVTLSEGNVLFEIDYKNALELYTKYLGPDAKDLPGSALLFPLSVIIPGKNQPVVRTILSIDNNKNSMTFAGDIPIGSKVRFMKANFDKISTAASNAAQNTLVKQNQNPQFALLISCVGRKLALGSRIDEEVESVNELFKNNTLLSGFYSYGEISPFNEGGSCQLHNQTMTITSFYEL